MFKSVTKAMKSVVMDKKAREALEKRSKAQAAPGTKPAAGKKTKASAAPPKRKARKEPSGGTLEKKLAQAGERVQNRQALIEEALSIHQKQAKLLDDVDPKTLEKLRRLAMEKILRDTLARRNDD